MNFLMRTALLVLSVFVAVFFGLMIALFVSETAVALLVAFLEAVASQGSTQIIATVVATLGVVLAGAIFVATILNGRLRKARIRKTDKGYIDIGVQAIENIALNSALSAQAGVKLAKARAKSAKGGKIKIVFTVMAYSDSELPAMMSKIQERVRKDVSRFTGIEVAEVIIRVSRVESVRIGVDR